MQAVRKSVLVSPAVVAALLAGCGGGSRTTLAGCLNDRHGFLVEQRAHGVTGQSPAGVGFTLTLYANAAAAAKHRTAETAVIENAVVDFGGNPGSARLSRAELAEIAGCIDAAK